VSELIIRNGTVLGAEGPVPADVLIRDGVVVEVAPAIDAGDIEEIDATGSWVGPGFVDVHSHLREPGEEYKEDIASGSAAAAAGGYTALVAMPNTDPAIDTGHLARYVLDRGRTVGLVDLTTAGCISAGREGRKLAHFDEMWSAGVRMFTDDGATVADAGLLRRAMEYVAQLGGIIAQHAIDPGLAAGGFMNEGPLSSRLGVQGIPALAEEVTIARDLALVGLTGARYHLQHVTTAGGVALIAEAKANGLAVTAEVTPHHLTFDDSFVEGTDAMFRMMPPLRSSADVAALREGLRAGTIDMVATDHAPHAPHEKDVPFEEAPNGVTGLEWAAAAVNSTTGLDIAAFFDRMSTAPAALGGFSDHGRPIAPGEPANITVFDPDSSVEATTTLSKSVNSPYLGRTWKGIVRATVLWGRVTHRATIGAEV